MDKRPIIIFDLDETLINTITLTDRHNTKNDLLFISKIVLEKNIEYVYNKETEEIIFKRPGLDEFLDFIYLYFNIGVFTKGVPDYAQYIVKKIIDTPIRRKIYNNQLCFLGTSLDTEYINKNYNNNYTNDDSMNDKQLKYIKNLFPNRYLILVDNREILGMNQENQFIHISDFSIFDEDSYNNFEFIRIKQMLSEFI